MKKGKKRDVSRRLRKESSMNWSRRMAEETGLHEVMCMLNDFQYEIRYCPRGTYTNIRTHWELADVVRIFAEKLNQTANRIETYPDDGEEPAGRSEPLERW